MEATKDSLKETPRGGASLCKFCGASFPDAKARRSHQNIVHHAELNWSRRLEPRPEHPRQMSGVEAGEPRDSEPKEMRRSKDDLPPAGEMVRIEDSNTDERPWARESLEFVRSNRPLDRRRASRAMSSSS
jgi:hypothetical protein